MMNNDIFVVSSWDDVTEYDLRLCNILEYYNVKGSFYPICSWIEKKISIRDIVNMSEAHEIGAHTINHVDLKTVPINVAKKEIVNSKKYLENIIEKEITSFVYPKGSYNKSHVKLVEEANFLCARTTKPFYIQASSNPFETHITIWTYPHAYKDLKALYRLLNIKADFAFRPNIIKQWDVLGKEIFDVVLESGGIFHFFGHAWQIERIDGWDKLENLLSYISNRKNVSYMTMTELVKKLSDVN